MHKIGFSKNFFFFFISLIFVIMIGGLYFEFNRVINETNTEINRIEIRRASALAGKIVSYLKEKTGENIEQLFKSKNLRDKLSDFLSLNITDEFKYIYVIYRDKKGFYHYLLDGSYGEDKAQFKQKFFPLLGKLWKDSFHFHRAVYGFQKKADGLWLTYLYPVIIHGKTEVVLALDVSTKEYKNLNKFLTPLYNFLKIFIAVLVIIAIAVSMQLYMFYKERKKSIIDSLTKLYNRNYLKEIWDKINLEKTAIIMLDIDHFKKINDNYGHDAGDIVLSSIAKKLTNETRLEDRVIRYGGEEFLILINFPKSDFEVISIAERILKSVANDKIRVDKNLSIEVTVSMGVNVNPAKCKNLKDAIKTADEMLYKAKNEGRNRVFYVNLSN